MTVKGQVSVVVVGAGLIGIDLIEKIQRSEVLDCRLVVGRDRQTQGLRRAAKMGCATAVGGIMSLLESGPPFNVVFAASNADCHAEHWSRLEATGATVIDLAPAQLGTMVVPTVNGTDVLAHRHINLVSCGGQAAIPSCTPSPRAPPSSTSRSSALGRAPAQAGQRGSTWTTTSTRRRPPSAPSPARMT
jgi:acetaldehyde dehydrogenase